MAHILAVVNLGKEKRKEKRKKKIERNQIALLDCMKFFF